jgi:MoaA/NifB/PqqE/SkfB family radical SAM enzyme
MFNLMPDGQVTRCCGYWYAKRGVMGNIADEELKSAISASKDDWKPCERSFCTAQCDGYYTEQIIATEDNFHEHIGWDVETLKKRTDDYCILQAHLTAACNFSCSYCCAKDWMNDLSRKDKPDLMVDAANFFTNTFKTGLVVVMGGEPLVSKLFVPFCSRFLNHKWNIQLVTNMSNPKKVIELCESSGSNASLMRVQISLHVNEPRFDADAIIDAIRRIRDRFGVQFATTIVGTEDNKTKADKDGLKKRFDEVGVLWYNVLDYFPN